MKQIVDVPEYDPERGLITEWEEQANIQIRIGDTGVIIQANAAGLRTLAQHFLVLAQDGLPAGAHLHLDDFAGLLPNSVELLIERIED